MTIVPVKQSVRVLAALYYFTGIGFGLSNIAVLVYVATQGRVPIVLGVDLDGGGPFESLGYRSMAVLIGLFVVVCLLEVVAARLLSRSGSRGGVLAIALLPVGAMFWFGFALPLPWFLGSLKAIFLAASWRQLQVPGPGIPANGFEKREFEFRGWLRRLPLARDCHRRCCTKRRESV